MFKKMIAKQLSKRLLTAVAKKESKIILGTLLTIGTHKAIQKVARKYPAFRFLKLERELQ